MRPATSRPLAGDAGGPVAGADDVTEVQAVRTCHLVHLAVTTQEELGAVAGVGLVHTGGVTLSLLLVSLGLWADKTDPD